MELLGQAFSPALDKLQASRAQLLGQAKQATAAFGSKGARVHMVFHTLQSLPEVSGTLAKFVVSEIGVKQSTDVRDHGLSHGPRVHH